MPEMDFIEPRLVGKRFESHSIPLDVLTDIAIIEDFVLDVAKRRFKERYPSRSRVPRGFSSGITLKLAGVREGSAIPILKLAMVGAFLLPTDDVVLLEESRDAIISAIHAAETGSNPLSYLPKESLTYFRKFGKSLQEGESIEFKLPAGGTTTSLTRETRRKLLLASGLADSFKEDIDLFGFVYEANKMKQTFQIQTVMGATVRGTIEAGYLDTVLEAFDGFEGKLPVRVHGTAVFNSQQEIQYLESITQMSIIDQLDISMRLNQLRHLKDGWLNGEGTAPSHEGLDWLSGKFASAYSETAQLPRLFPTVELSNGIVAEWFMAGHNATLEINLDTHAAEWHVLDLKTQKSEELSFDLNDDNSWKELSSKIITLGGHSV